MFIIDPAAGPAHSVFAGLGILSAVAYVVLLAPARGKKTSGEGASGAGTRHALRFQALALLGICAAVGFAGALVVGAATMGGIGPGLTGRGSSLGLLLGGVLAAWGGSRFMDRTDWLESLDLVVPAGLLGLGFGHLGCLFRGCDFGRVTPVSWAVAYEGGSGPWVWHQMQEGLPVGASHSLGTHPFGLYLGLGTVLFVLLVSVVARLRPTAAPGSTAALAALGYLATRSVAELFREPVFLPFFVSRGGVGLHLLHPLLLIAFGVVAILWYRGIHVSKPARDGSS